MRASVAIWLNEEALRPTRRLAPPAGPAKRPAGRSSITTTKAPMKAMQAMMTAMKAAKPLKKATMKPAKAPTMKASPAKGKAMKAMTAMKAMKATKAMKAAMQARSPPKEAKPMFVPTMSKGTPPEHSFKTWYFTSRRGWSLSRLEVDIQNQAVHETWMRDPPAAE